MIRVIFNADDLGFSMGINRGIAYCFKRKAVTSTSIFANMPATSHAISLSRKNKISDIGIHLNLTNGKSMTGNNSLTNKEGGFFNAYILFYRLTLGLVNMQDVDNELKAQIDYIIDKGIFPNHIDFHMYMHSYSSLNNICIRLCSKYGIKKMRHNYDSNLVRDYKRFFDFQYYKLLMIKSIGKNQRETIKKNGIKTPDYFHGILQMSSKDRFSYFLELIKNLKDGVNEIMCHPGYADKELSSYSPYFLQREEELKVLCSPILRKALINRKIHLIGYKDL